MLTKQLLGDDPYRKQQMATQREHLRKALRPDPVGFVPGAAKMFSTDICPPVECGVLFWITAPGVYYKDGSETDGILRFQIDSFGNSSNPVLVSGYNHDINEYGFFAGDYYIGDWGDPLTVYETENPNSYQDHLGWHDPDTGKGPYSFRAAYKKSNNTYCGLVSQVSLDADDNPVLPIDLWVVSKQVSEASSYSFAKASMPSHVMSNYMQWVDDDAFETLQVKISHDEKYLYGTSYYACWVVELATNKVTATPYFDGGWTWSVDAHPSISGRFVMLNVPGSWSTNYVLIYQANSMDDFPSLVKQIDLSNYPGITYVSLLSGLAYSPDGKKLLIVGEMYNNNLAEGEPGWDISHVVFDLEKDKIIQYGYWDYQAEGWNSPGFFTEYCDWLDNDCYYIADYGFGIFGNWKKKIITKAASPDLIRQAFGDDPETSSRYSSYFVTIDAKKVQP